MARSRLYTAALCGLILAVNVAFGAPKLVIHHIGVGHGDCTLIVATDLCEDNKERTYAVLIDPGPGPANAHKPIDPSKLLTAVESLLVKYGATRLNFFVVSHFHEDHYGSATYFLKQLALPAYSTMTKYLNIVDRLNFSKSGNYSIVALPSPDTKIKKNASVFYYYNNQRKKVPKSWGQPAIKVGQNLFDGTFSDGKAKDKSKYAFKNIRMFCVAANGFANNLRVCNSRKENALSFAWYLEFGAFRYYTGADLDGENSSRYVDMEGPIADYLTGKWTANNFHVCCMKVGHHGSEHSSINMFINKMKPTVAVITAGKRTFGGKDADDEEEDNASLPLPRQATITNLKAVTAKIYYTYIPNGVTPKATKDSHGDSHALYYEAPPPKTEALDAFQDVAIEVSTNQATGAGVSVQFAVKRYRRNFTTLDVNLDNPVTRTETCSQSHIDRSTAITLIK